MIKDEFKFAHAGNRVFQLQFIFERNELIYLASKANLLRINHALHWVVNWKLVVEISQDSVHNIDTFKKSEKKFSRNVENHSS